MQTRQDWKKKKKCKEADRRAEITGTENGEGSRLGDGREQKCDLTSSFGFGTLRHSTAVPVAAGNAHFEERDVTYDVLSF